MLTDRFEIDGLIVERDPIEVTRSRLLPPFVADTSRQFVPGPATAMLTVVHGGETREFVLTNEELDHLQAVKLAADQEWLRALWER